MAPFVFFVFCFLCPALIQADRQIAQADHGQFEYVLVRVLIRPDLVTDNEEVVAGDEVIKPFYTKKECETFKDANFTDHRQGPNPHYYKCFRIDYD